MGYDDHNMFDWSSSALWKDENFDVTAYQGSGASPPDVITIPGTSITTMSFDGASTTEEIQVCKELNHDYKAGTPLAFHIHWYPTTTASGIVKWQLQYWISSQWHPDTTLSGLLSVSSEASRTAWRIQTSNFPDLDLGAIADMGNQIHFRFFRDPTADVYPDDAAVATMGYHYQTDSRGSAQRSSKK